MVFKLHFRELTFILDQDNMKYNNNYLCVRKKKKMIFFFLQMSIAGRKG